MATEAELFSEWMGHDTDSFEDPYGFNFDSVLQTFRAAPPQTGTGKNELLTRHVFPDGSAIIESNQGWYIEGAEPFCER